MEKQFVLTGFADEISADTTAQLEGLKKLGVTHIEPRNIDGKNIIKLTDEEVAAFKAKLEKYGISVSSIGSPLGKIKITDDFDAHFEEFKRTVEIAKMLDTKYIRMFSFFVDEKEADQKTDEVIEKLSKMVAYAEKHDVILLHENEKAFTATSQDAVRCFLTVLFRRTSRQCSIFPTLSSAPRIRSKPTICLKSISYTSTSRIAKTAVESFRPATATVT